MRFTAEFERNTTAEIEAPSEDAADYAAYTYSAVNRMTGRYIGLKEEPPALLRINPDSGMVEAFWVDGSYREIAPNGAPYRPRVPESPQRVLVLVLADIPDRSPVEVLLLPSDWGDDDIDRYVNTRSDWTTFSVTTVGAPVEEEAEQP